MSNIKTFNELRKLVRDTKWLEMKFSKEEVHNQFNLNTRDIEHSTMFLKPNKEVEEYVFNQHRFDHRIDKKKQADVYYLRLSKIKNDWGNRSLYSNENGNKKIFDDTNVKSYSIYEFIGRKDAGRYGNCFYPSNMLVWVNNYTDQILFVRYKREDIWFNNFFKNKFDSSVNNNFDELFVEREFNLLYSNTTYKIFNSKGLDYSDAKEKLEKENPELKWRSGRVNGKWHHEYGVKETKVPSNVDFDINDFEVAGD